MSIRRAAVCLGVCLIAVLLASLGVRGAEQSDNQSPAPVSVSAKEARERAKLLHGVLRDTLLVVHRDFFREEQKLAIPSQSFEEVFEELQQRSGVVARWISVNTDPLNVDHRPDDKFERQAATALDEGESEYVLVEEDRLRYAASIPLGNVCLKCHVPFRTSRTKTRMAGLTLSIPLK